MRKKTENTCILFKGYTEDGKLQVIKRMMNRELHTGAFIKIYAKGMQGKGWAEIPKESIPQKSVGKNRKTIKRSDSFAPFFSALK